jgi:hypothetical protein
LIYTTRVGSVQPKSAGAPNTDEPRYPTDRIAAYSPTRHEADRLWRCTSRLAGHAGGMSVVVIGQLGRDLALRTARLPATGGTEPVGGEPQVVDQPAERFFPLFRRSAEDRRGMHGHHQIRRIPTVLSGCV